MNTAAAADSTRRAPRVLLAVLALIAMVVLTIGLLIAFFRDDLPVMAAADLAAAEARWAAKGPASYDLDLVIGGERPGLVHVEVRNGKATAMSRDGRTPDQPRTWGVWTVPGQFETIGRELELAADPQRQMQAPPGTRLILQARFHPELGYPLRYRRLVIGQAPAVSWETLQFTRKE